MSRPPPSPPSPYPPRRAQPGRLARMLADLGALAGVLAAWATLVLAIIGAGTVAVALLSIFGDR